LDAIPAIGGKRGQPSRRPLQVYADRGYDHDKPPPTGPRQGHQPVIARRGTEHGSGPGKIRWVSSPMTAAGS
jgi:hypothetical protein